MLLSFQNECFSFTKTPLRAWSHCANIHISTAGRKSAQRKRKQFPPADRPCGCQQVLLVKTKPCFSLLELFIFLRSSGNKEKERQGPPLHQLNIYSNQKSNKLGQRSHFNLMHFNLLAATQNTT